VNKEDLQKLYTEIKTKKLNNAEKNQSLIKPPVKKGCSSCGKVKWKPNKSN
jgi:hypothetical protein